MKKETNWSRTGLLENIALQPLHPVIGRLPEARFPSLDDCNGLLAACDGILCVHSGLPLRFVPQEYGRLPFERQYEPRCYLHGEVMTREHNWHDLLNALVWLTFPRAKAAINRRHYRALTGSQDDVSGSQRGAVRDMNTLFDESGVVVLYAEDALADLMRGFRWKELFWLRRDAVQAGMGFYLFGHGLYEKALAPYVGMTGQGLLLPVAHEFFSWPLEQRLAYLDAEVAAYLDHPQHCCDTHELTPVPLLGVPGWWAGNGQEGFYDNTDYFRPGRQSRAQRTPLITAPSSVAG
jgi:hypothetical protein